MLRMIHNYLTQLQTQTLIYNLVNVKLLTDSAVIICYQQLFYERESVRSKTGYANTAEQ